MAPVAVMVIGVVGASVAHGASLGGLSVASLWTWTSATSIELPDPPGPPPAACDDFVGASGSLDGHTSSCGATWSVSGGNWSLGNGILRATGPSGLATMPVGTSDMTVSVDLIDPHANNRQGGVVAAHGPTSRLIAMIEGAGTLNLRFVNGNATVSLASVAIPTAPVSRLSVTRIGTAVTVRVDGQISISHTLTALQSSQLTGTAAGLTKTQGPPAEFDDFEVTIP